MVGDAAQPKDKSIINKIKYAKPEQVSIYCADNEGKMWNEENEWYKTHVGLDKYLGLDNYPYIGFNKSQVDNSQCQVATIEGTRPPNFFWNNKDCHRYNHGVTYNIKYTPDGTELSDTSGITVDRYDDLQYNFYKKATEGCALNFIKPDHNTLKEAEFMPMNRYYKGLDENIDALIPLSADGYKDPILMFTDPPSNNKYKSIFETKVADEDNFYLKKYWEFQKQGSHGVATSDLASNRLYKENPDNSLDTPNKSVIQWFNDNDGSYLEDDNTYESNVCCMDGVYYEDDFTDANNRRKYYCSFDIIDDSNNLISDMGHNEFLWTLTRPVLEDIRQAGEADNRLKRASYGAINPDLDQIGYDYNIPYFAKLNDYNNYNLVNDWEYIRFSAPYKQSYKPNRLYRPIRAHGVTFPGDLEPNESKGARGVYFRSSSSPQSGYKSDFYADKESNAGYYDTHPYLISMDGYVDNYGVYDRDLQPIIDNTAVDEESYEIHGEFLDITSNLETLKKQFTRIFDEINANTGFNYNDLVDILHKNIVIDYDADGSYENMTDFGMGDNWGETSDHKLRVQYLDNNDVLITRKRNQLFDERALNNFIPDPDSGLYLQKSGDTYISIPEDVISGIASTNCKKEASTLYLDKAVDKTRDLSGIDNAYCLGTYQPKMFFDSIERDGASASTQWDHPIFSAFVLIEDKNTLNSKQKDFIEQLNDTEQSLLFLATPLNFIHSDLPDGTDISGISLINYYIECLCKSELHVLGTYLYKVYENTDDSSLRRDTVSSTINSLIPNNRFKIETVKNQLVCVNCSAADGKRDLNTKNNGDFDPKSRPLFVKQNGNDDIVWLSKPSETGDDFSFINLDETVAQSTDNTMYSYYAIAKLDIHLYEGITYCNGVKAPHISTDGSCSTVVDDSGKAVDDIGEFNIYFDIDFVNVNMPFKCPDDFDSIDFSFTDGYQGTFIKNPYTDLIYKSQRVDIYAGEVLSLHLQSNPNFFRINEYINENDVERNTWKFPHTTLKAPDTTGSVDSTDGPSDDSEVIIEISNESGTGCFKTMRTNLITNVSIIAKEMGKIGKDFSPASSNKPSKDLGETTGDFPSDDNDVTIFKTIGNNKRTPSDYKNLDYFAYIRAFCLDAPESGNVDNISLVGSNDPEHVLYNTKDIIASFTNRVKASVDGVDTTYSAYPLYHKYAMEKNIVALEKLNKELQNNNFVTALNRVINNDHTIINTKSLVKLPDSGEISDIDISDTGLVTDGSVSNIDSLVPDRGIYKAWCKLRGSNSSEWETAYDDDKETMFKNSLKILFDNWENNCENSGDFTNGMLGVPGLKGVLNHSFANLLTRYYGCFNPEILTGLRKVFGSNFKIAIQAKGTDPPHNDFDDSGNYRFLRSVGSRNKYKKGEDATECTNGHPYHLGTCPFNDSRYHPLYSDQSKNRQKRVQDHRSKSLNGLAYADAGSTNQTRGGSDQWCYGKQNMGSTGFDTEDNAKGLACDSYYNTDPNQDGKPGWGFDFMCSHQLVNSDVHYIKKDYKFDDHEVYEDRLWEVDASSDGLGEHLRFIGRHLSILNDKTASITDALYYKTKWNNDWPKPVLSSANVRSHCKYYENNDYTGSDGDNPAVYMQDRPRNVNNTDFDSQKILIKCDYETSYINRPNGSGGWRANSYLSHRNSKASNLKNVSGEDGRIFWAIEDRGTHPPTVSYASGGNLEWTIMPDEHYKNTINVDNQPCPEGMLMGWHHDWTEDVDKYLACHCGDTLIRANKFHFDAHDRITKDVEMCVNFDTPDDDGDKTIESDMYGMTSYYVGAITDSDNPTGGINKLDLIPVEGLFDVDNDLLETGGLLDDDGKESLMASAGKNSLDPQFLTWDHVDLNLQDLWLKDNVR